MMIKRIAAEIAFLGWACVVGCSFQIQPESGVTAEDCPEFGYGPEDGPEVWGSLCSAYAHCDEGKQQSPINITGAEEDEEGDIDFSYRPVTFTATNSGETVRVDAATGGDAVVLDGVRYSLRQFHFHIPSEHTLEGESFPMELHLVHEAVDNSLAVVGVLVLAGAENQVLAALFHRLPNRGETVSIQDPIDLNRLLPADRTVFRYIGSLTTPPCSEGLYWNVLAAPIELSAEQIESYDRLIGFNTNRPIQPLQGRTITLAR